MAKTAFIGLGVMGYWMAGHMAKAGHDVTVYNRTGEKAAKWAGEFGGATADTPAKAASGAELVMTCVGNDDDLRSVCLGPDGAFAGMEAGSALVDHTTVSADVTRELCKTADDSGLGFIDAPISGGEAGAKNGALSVMCGGDEDVYRKAEPVIASYSKICRRMGGTGAGQLTKMANQICIAGLVQGLAEGLYFVEKAGLSIPEVVEVISQGAAGSWQMSNRHETMANDEFDFGFAVDLMRKDLGICLEEAKSNGASLPVTEIVDGFYKDVQDLGGGRWDTSSLIRRLRAKSG